MGAKDRLGAYPFKLKMAIGRHDEYTRELGGKDGGGYLVPPRPSNKFSFYPPLASIMALCGEGGFTSTSVF
jgi:hypothetical protein